jgi:hypothetical protein
LTAAVPAAGSGVVRAEFSGGAAVELRTA